MRCLEAGCRHCTFPKIIPPEQKGEKYLCRIHVYQSEDKGDTRMLQCILHLCSKYSFDGTTEKDFFKYRSDDTYAQNTEYIVFHLCKDVFGYIGGDVIAFLLSQFIHIMAAAPIRPLRGFVLLGPSAAKQRLILTKLVPDLIPAAV